MTAWFVPCSKHGLSCHKKWLDLHIPINWGIPSDGGRSIPHVPCFDWHVWVCLKSGTPHSTGEKHHSHHHFIILPSPFLGASPILGQSQFFGIDELQKSLASRDFSPSTKEIEKWKKACSIRLIRWDDQLNKPALDEFASLCIQVGISRKNLQLAHFNMPFLTPNQRNHPSFWGDRGSDQGCHGEGILWGDQGVGICWGMILGWILGNEMGLIPFFLGKKT